MFCSHVRYVCLYVCMYVCMHVCTKSFLKTTTNSSCVCTHLANKADSDSDSDLTPVSSAGSGQACALPDRQHCNGCVHQPSRGSMLSSHVTPHPPSLPLESNMAQITACNSLPGGAQSCSRCALITNYKGTETPYTGGLDDLELIRGSSGGPVCFPGVFPLLTVLFPD